MTVMAGRLVVTVSVSVSVRLKVSVTGYENEVVKVVSLVLVSVV